MAHVKKKQNELGLNKQTKLLIGRNSSLKLLVITNNKITTKNKLLLYKQVLKPTWSYNDMQLSTYAPKQPTYTNSEHKMLRNIPNVLLHTEKKTVI